MLRGGDTVLVPNTDVVVGDVMLLNTGDKLIADGLMLDGHHLVIDEASLTGESDPIKKGPDVDPWLRSGTQVSEGSGRMLVVAVGAQSEWGKTMALVSEAGGENTPLQDNLSDLAGAIAKVGFGVAAACFLALLIKWCVVNKGFPISKINDNGPVQFFLYAVTIVVVAVPEGLPLAVTIALAYSMKKMMKVCFFFLVFWVCFVFVLFCLSSPPNPCCHTHTQQTNNKQQKNNRHTYRTTTLCACCRRARPWAARRPSAPTRPVR